MRASSTRSCASSIGAGVDELVVAAPFYDAEAVALDEHINRIRPQRVRLLVQPERTSVNPTAVDRLAARFPGQFEIVPIKRPDDPYIHAKLILVTAGERALCVQGSPNLSHVALVRSGVDANIELANALAGARGDFDSLLAGLEFGSPEASAAALALAYEPLDTEPPEALTGWHLTRGQWENNELILHFRGDPPELSEGSLLVGGHRFELDVLASVQALAEWVSARRPKSCSIDRCRSSSLGLTATTKRARIRSSRTTSRHSSAHSRRHKLRSVGLGRLA